MLAFALSRFSPVSRVGETCVRPPGAGARRRSGRVRGSRGGRGGKAWPGSGRG